MTCDFAAGDGSRQGARRAANPALFGLRHHPLLREFDHYSVVGLITL